MPRFIVSGSLGRALRKHLNFYRVHILVFTFTPLIFSAIFYASNGRYHISYIDSLFNCVSAMTVCGLATVNLSTLTGWQQTILFIQMCLGSPVAVSWVMVYIRRHYFAKKFDHIVAAEAARRLERQETRRLSKVESRTKTIPSPPLITRTMSRWSRLFRGRTHLSSISEGSQEQEREKGNRSRGEDGKVRPDMIRRMDEAPKLINPSGWISEGNGNGVQANEAEGAGAGTGRQLAFAESPQPNRVALPIEGNSDESAGDSNVNATREERTVTRSRTARRLSDPGVAPPPQTAPPKVQRFETVHVGPPTPPSTSVPDTKFARTQTVEFAPTPRPPPMIGHAHAQSFARGRQRSVDLSAERIGEGSAERRPGSMPSRPTRPLGAPLQSMPTAHTYRSTSARTKTSGFGGFPMPHEILSDLLHRFFPKLRRTITRTLTVPVTSTIGSYGTGGDGRTAPYITFEAVVGRNSAFHALTNEQLEELGGVEYRGLNALLWLVAIYHFALQILAYVVIAPYISTRRWRSAFVPPQLFRNVPPAWFALFQVVSAYTNTGMSLVDTSMVPFQKAYVMIVFMIVLILAGNTAFPIFLRLFIWTITKFLPQDSRLNETLHFLLDHPRRCFIYLFPSHQTWFLLTVLVALNCTDWFFFMVLDIGNPAIEKVPLGTRFIIGLLQATAVRAAGFGTVALSALAPAVKVLYVIMMYVSIYPIAMSVRSTNVYEEKSLGVFGGPEDSDDEEEFEEQRQAGSSRVAVWSRYLTMHARRQLAFDMWWLGLALFLVCIIERGQINDETNESWFNIFNIVFELVSAYGTVGLSLGLPYDNYSFAGAFSPLSKLIVCAVMLRGRHRGLPVAIDRAVMLPSEFKESASAEEKGPRRRSSQVTFASSAHAPEKRGSSDDATDWRRRRGHSRSSTAEEWT